MLDRIELRGARTHNLKGVSCVFPHGGLTVVTGVSGSGKSSLAFDTLYAEGQRRYVESLSTYARQFLERMERPAIESLTGLQPAIALEQRNAVRSARSTVGTATEIHDYLRLLFARLGRTECPTCRREVRPETPESALATLMSLPQGTRLIVVAPTGITAARLTPTLRAELIRAGYHRLWDGSALVDLEAEATPSDPHVPLAIVVDRLAVAEADRTRLHAALQTAFQAGQGRAVAEVPDRGERFPFSAGMMCDGCGERFPAPEPRLFSFDNPLGACPACQGFGRIMELDLEKVIPDPERCIEDGAIAPWNSEGSIEMYDLLRRRTTPQQIPRLKPIAAFTPAQRENLIEGVGRFPGVRGFFQWLESKKYKVQARVMLARYRAYRTCPVCGGARLRPEALNVRLAGRTIAELASEPIGPLADFFGRLALTARERQIAGGLIEMLGLRLSYLQEIGLSYLSLDRPTRTLSGGEAQRINLAASLGSGLTQTLYVLDEPTVGLHARDTERLIRTLQGLRDLGNTVVVVEHDLDVIRAADRLIDLGPGAGEAGGELLFEGRLDEINGLTTPTARHLAGYPVPPVPTRGRPAKGWIRILGARGNNLKGLDVAIPLGGIVGVTGVSGSGKTTLVRDTLTAAWRRRRELAPVEAAPCRAIEGLEALEELIWVDQTPLARSSRSNPVTYVKAMDPIRDTLASTREARALGLKPADFSFNVEGGRCPTCKGTGYQTIDMRFMADVEVLCESCDGRRFRDRVLVYRYQAKTITDILDLTVDEAARFFAGEPRVVRALRPLREVGLGYLRLGQSTATLSGGEAQRLKLAGRLARMRDGRGLLLVFDEPTTGLHAADVERLLRVLHDLVERGCSILVVEHNLDLIASADWIIDLGPEGGEGGGRIVAEGPPAQIARCETSWTGRHLRRRFGF